MSIREKGYHRWQGELKLSGVTWLPIFLNGIKTAFRKKYAKIFFTAINMPFLIFAAGLFFSTKPELHMLSEVVRLLKSDSRFFQAFFTNGFLIFMLMMLCVFVFSELISGDLKFNSFPLYFSRPLDRKDYILGKFSIVMFYLLLFTLVPGILLLLLKFIFLGKIVVEPRVLFGVVVVPVTISVFFAAVTLLVSSLSSNGRYVKIIIFLFFVFSNSIAEILKAIFKSSYFNLFSVGRNLEQLGTFIFGVRPVFSAPGWMSLVVVVGIIAFSFFMLFKKIGKSEAQIEIGS